MKILNAEYNDDVVGFVVRTSKGDVNVQFDKVFSNHPEPKFKLCFGCAGDETIDKFNDEEREQISEFMANNTEMRELENKFTEAYYNGSNLPELCSPISKIEILDRADTPEEYPAQNT